MGFMNKVVIGTLVLYVIGSTQFGPYVLFPFALLICLGVAFFGPKAAPKPPMKPATVAIIVIAVVVVLILALIIAFLAYIATQIPSG
jgi:uncharacterized membrane protein YcaP (DUF421 family)